MTGALSNPYELTVDGITCKVSPFGGGYYISARDLDDLGSNSAAFQKALFNAYDVEQSKELDGIKVLSKKWKPNVETNIEEKKQSSEK